ADATRIAELRRRNLLLRPPLNLAAVHPTVRPRTRRLSSSTPRTSASWPSPEPRWPHLSPSAQRPARPSGVETSAQVPVGGRVRRICVQRPKPRLPWMSVRQSGHQDVEVVLGTRLDPVIEQDGLDELLGRLLAEVRRVPVLLPRQRRGPARV